MVATLPMAALAPQDYRYALDSVLSLFVDTSPLVLCNIAQLGGELRQRGLDKPQPDRASSALWIEPSAASWRSELQRLAAALHSSAPLAIIASRPLARLVLERRFWSAPALGMRPGGIALLHRELGRAGFTLEARFGIHSLLAIGLGVLSRQCERLGRPDIGDRLHFAARLRYCTDGPLAMSATVALLFARKAQRRW